MRHRSFTAYRMTTTDDLGRRVATLGVLGALELSRPDEGEILPHEHTTPKAKSDRLDLLRGTPANLSAIWGLSLAKGLTELLPVDGSRTSGGRTRRAPCTRPGGSPTRHLRGHRAKVSSAPVVVADGHHRYETSLAYRDERRAAVGSGTAAEPPVLRGRAQRRAAHRAGHPPSGARLRPTSTSPPRSRHCPEPRRWGRRRRRRRFGAGAAQMDELEAMAVVGADGGARLVRLDPAQTPDLDDLDSARLAAALHRIGEHELTYQHGTDRAQQAVLDGAADWAVLIRPVTVVAIERNAHEGRRMPPKSTFFHPKPRTGIVFRTLE
jgi:hypothetical protein